MKVFYCLRYELKIKKNENNLIVKFCYIFNDFLKMYKN